MRPVPPRPLARLLLLPLAALACAGDDAAGESSALPITGASQGASASGSASTSSAGTQASEASTTADTADASGSSGGGATSGAELVDDAELVALDLPMGLACGVAESGAITLRNRGTSTWTRAAGYRLGAVEESDPLAPVTRVELPEGVAVAPGQAHTFALALNAPARAGLYTSDWQMIREGVHWFGEIAADDVDVACAPEEPPPLDLSQVIWLHTDVSGWPETMTLESVSFGGGQICMNHGSDAEGVFVWPVKLLDGNTEVVGNPWVFIYRDDAWYAATWEWLRPNQTCKAMTSVAGDHIKKAPFDAGSGWTPSSGETLYFMVSALARQPGFTNVSERSAPVKVVWP